MVLFTRILFVFPPLWEEITEVAIGISPCGLVRVAVRGRKGASGLSASLGQGPEKPEGQMTIKFIRIANCCSCLNSHRVWS